MTQYELYDIPGREPESSVTRLGTAAWLLAGIGIGVGAALLLSPNLRRSLAHKCRSAFHGIGGSISRGTQELREHGSNLLNFNRRQIG